MDKHRVSLLVLGAFVCLGWLNGGESPAAKPSPKVPRPQPLLASRAMSFVPNVGQAAPEVSFVGRGRDGAVLITGDGFALALDSVGRTTNPQRRLVKVRWAGGNPTHAEGQERLPGVASYFLGKDPSKWRASVATFRAVHAVSAYPGIDLVYYGAQGHLEYDFVVSAGADPDAIRIEVDGADAVRLDGKGDLLISVAGTEIRQLRPHVYQDIDGVRREIESGYRLERKGGQIAFRLGNFDRRRRVVIDPTLVYSTYLGGNGNDSAASIAIDGSGNAYLAGSTASTNFPVTAGVYQSSNRGQTVTGNDNVFITKLSADGSTELYSTYLGGTTNDTASDIAVDASGNAYVVGAAGSTDFPTTTGAYRTTAGAAGDAFVTKLNSTGTALVYSTYLAGSGNDAANAVAVDASGNAYVGGTTYSVDFPTTAGAYKTTYSGAPYSDVFVTKLNAAGTGLVYSTYLGGNLNESLQTRGLALDSSGNVYVGGYTGSSNFPTTAGALRTSNPNSFADGFVTKLNAAGNGLTYSTLIGASGNDYVNAIAIDSAGNVFIAGQTGSTDLPVTAGAPQATKNPGGSGWDGFVAKLNSTGSAFVYATYLGGNDTDSPNGIAVDSAGVAYVVGQTLSTDFPTTPGGQQTNAGMNDAFFTKVNATGTAFLSSSYLGGNGDDIADAVVIDASRNVFIAGGTTSSNFPTAAPFQATGGAYSDAFVAKLAGPPSAASITPTSGYTLGGTSVTITGTNFFSGATVSFGSTAAGSVTVVSSTSITASTPAHAAGAVNVVIANSDGQSTTMTGAFTYQTPPPPTISSISPTSGTSNGGTAFTITGTNFFSGATVSIGGVTPTSVTVVSGTQITGVTGAHAGGPAVGVTVTNPDSQSATLSAGYTYVAAPAPTITSVTPSSGTDNGGTPVTITGTGYVAGSALTIAGSAPSSVTVVSATQITATTLPHSAGAVAVAVGNPDGQTVSSANGYTYVAPPAPTVTTVTPSSGYSNTSTPVTIAGTGFAAGASVTIGGTAAASVTVVSATSITAVAVPHAIGPADVVVRNTDGQSGTKAGGFTYNPPPPPSVSAISPTSGTTFGGTAVTVTGSAFVSGASVAIGGTAATSVTVVSATQITATTGAHSAGAANVVVTNPDSQTGTLTNGYTYVAPPPPAVSSISPTSGPSNGGTAFTVTGTGFINGATVALGGTAATSVTVVSATQITGTTAGHPAGAVNLVVTNPDNQTGTLASAYTYNPSPAPAATSISPTSGPSNGGTAVTIAGTGFAAGATVTIGSVAASATTVSSATQITATTGAHPAGVTDVVVTNPDGQSVILSGAYTYVASPPPTLSSVSPSSGPATGGTVVTLSGTGFATGATVNVGGALAGSMVNGPTSITATVGAHPAGSADVTVTNPDGQSVTSPGAFRYTPGPSMSVSSINPTVGPENGGTAVTISGSLFAAGATVTIGGSKVVGLRVVNDTTLTASTPNHAAGAVDVVVSEPDGSTSTLPNGFTYQAAKAQGCGCATTEPPLATGLAFLICLAALRAGKKVRI